MVHSIAISLGISCDIKMQLSRIISGCKVIWAETPRHFPVPGGSFFFDWVWNSTGLSSVIPLLQTGFKGCFEYKDFNIYPFFNAHKKFWGMKNIRTNLEYPHIWGVPTMVNKKTGLDYFNANFEAIKNKFMYLSKKTMDYISFGECPLLIYRTDILENEKVTELLDLIKKIRGNGTFKIIYLTRAPAEINSGLVNNYYFNPVDADKIWDEIMGNYTIETQILKQYRVQS
jgi:hypothetical protein